MPKENTKEKLIDAAILCLSEKGYEDTSVSFIVKQAKVAQGTFYIYFKTKYDMVLAIAQRILDEQLALFQSIAYKSIPMEAFLLEWITIVFDTMDKNKSLIGYVMAKSAEKDRYLLWEKLYTPTYQWLEGVIDYYQSNHQCVLEINNRSLVILLMGMVEESAEQYYLYTSNPPPCSEPIALLHRFLMRSLLSDKKNGGSMHDDVH